MYANFVVGFDSLALNSQICHTITMRCFGMKCNVGKTEQILRVGIGVVIVLLGLYFSSWWGIIGLLPIITGSIRYCPLSKILGISTCKLENN